MLLAVPTNLNKSSLNAIVRVVGGPLIAENCSIMNGLQTALRRVQLGLDNKTSSYFIFKNLYDLIKLEKMGTNVHLKRQSVLQATQASISNILSMWMLLLEQINDDLENTNLCEAELTEKNISNVHEIKEEKEEIRKSTKKIKKEKVEENMEVDEGEITEDDNNFVLNDQIHIIANIIDMLDIGKNDPLPMSDVSWI